MSVSINQLFITLYSADRLSCLEVRRLGTTSCVLGRYPMMESSSFFPELPVPSELSAFQVVIDSWRFSTIYTKSSKTTTTVSKCM